MNNPIAKALDALLDDQEQRHAWLFEAGEQIRRWKEEELANALRAPSLSSASPIEPVPVSTKGFNLLSEGENT